jgi:hypothetical protein
MALPRCWRRRRWPLLPAAGCVLLVGAALVLALLLLVLLYRASLPCNGLDDDDCMQDASALVAAGALAALRVPLPGTRRVPAQALQPHAVCTEAADGVTEEERRRTRMCTWRDLCVDARHGVFVPDVHAPDGTRRLAPRATDPRHAAVGAHVNLRTIESARDYFWEPVLAAPAAAPDGLVDYAGACVLYVQLATYPYHLSHFLYNVALPALATRMATEAAMRDRPPPCAVWAPVKLFDAELEPRWRRPLEFAWLNFTQVMPMALSNALLVDDVLEGDLFHDFQRIVPVPSVTAADLAVRPTCFARTVLGTGSRCAVSHCASRPDPAVYAEARRLAFAFVDGSGDPGAPRSPAGGLVVLVERKETRRVINHVALLAALRAAGIDVRSVTLSGATFAEQVTLFRDAAVVLAPHGNANGNILWMAPGGTLIEMFAFEVAATFFEDIAHELGVRYMAWRCMDRSCIAPGQEHLKDKLFYRDMLVSVPEVVQLVHSALAAVH